MRGWDAARVAHAAGAKLIAEPSPGVVSSQGVASSAGVASAAKGGESGPKRAVIDSREVGSGDLFIGLRGEHLDGGEYGVQALAAGAWGVLVAPEYAERALAGALAGPGGAVLVHPDPLAGLQALARAWRRELGAAGMRVVAVTGSTGKTSTKDILAAVLGGRLRTVASAENLNTEIGLPLSVLAAPAGTEALVLEMAMRGAGQIAELTEIAEPEVGVIVNVGPVHLELLGSLRAIAAAKAELIAGMAAGTTMVVPVDEPLLEPHRRGDMNTVTFGAGGDVELVEQRTDGEVVIAAGTEQLGLRPSFVQPHNLSNLLAAVAAARALGITPEGRLEVRFSALRGERIALPGGITLINDCYNANPMSMRAAIDDLSSVAPARRLAVLGDMLELGPEAGPGLHREVAAHAAARGVEVLVTVGPLAAAMAGEAFGGETHAVPDAEAAAELLGVLLREGDTVLVKGSRGVGLERVARALVAEGQAHGSGSISARSAERGERGSDRGPTRGSDRSAGRR
ncbi:MAG TPA: UDP-N-acetylmuramoyl-tripeptide--D-alanyl-D-alanine ligase [Solirubrobacteraceae bacterium]